MSFRKRNVAPISRATPPPGSVPASNAPIAPTALPSRPTPPPAGTRPSSYDSTRLCTSTGTPSLDALLGHSGIPLGTCLLLEESGTTDYAGTLLRTFAAEGVVQGHRVIVVGVGQAWGRELPGIVEGKGEKGGMEMGRVARGMEGMTEKQKERMKIAWRYERLGEHGSELGGGERGESCRRFTCRHCSLCNSVTRPLRCFAPVSGKEEHWLNQCW
jgi:elongator complex protein 4